MDKPHNTSENHNIKLISQQACRRYILGHQGLWPGQQWTSESSVEQILHEIEAVQIDSTSLGLCSNYQTHF